MASSNDMIALHCFILHDYPWRTFPIRVSRDAYITELKPVIQAAYKQTTDGVEVFNLALFCVDMGVDELQGATVSADDHPLQGSFLVEDFWPRGQSINRKRIQVLIQGSVTQPVPQPQTPYDDVVGEWISKFEQLNTRQDSLAKHFQDGQSAPTAAYPANFASQQTKGVNPIYNGRPAERTKLPVQLYHPAFDVFEAELASNDELTHSQCTTVQGLLLASQKTYRDEAERTQEVKPFLSAAIGKTIGFEAIQKCEADGVVQFFNSSGKGRLAYGAIVEVKNEIGVGNSDPSIQGAESYAMYWSQEKMSQLRRACCCPSLIIAIAGPWICILGAIYLDDVVVQPLTDGYLWLGYHPQKASGLVHLARIFRAISATLDYLDKYYALLLSETHPLKNDQRFFPYVRQYTDSNNTVVEFSYKEQMAKSNIITPVFLAVTKGEDRCIVIKFAETYNFVAHKLLAENSLAPNLFFHSQTAMYGGFWMITMEYCGTSLDKYCGSADLLQLCPLVRDDIALALKLLHDNGMVFGDLRPPNILIVEDAKGRKRGRLVDFDWCGGAGVTRYPANINPDIDWAAGVERNGLLSEAHDEEMFNAVFK